MDQSELTVYFYDIFDASLPRLGPGDDSSTQKAIELLRAARPERMNLPASIGLRILDLGCGNGAPTILLAKHLDGTIVAVDNHEQYLVELRRRAVAEGVSDKIRTSLSDMRDFTMGEEGGFDLIWSRSKSRMRAQRIYLRSSPKAGSRLPCPRLASHWGRSRRRLFERSAIRPAVTVATANDVMAPFGSGQDY